MKYRKDLIYPVAFVIAAALSIGYKVLASGKLDRIFSFGGRSGVTVESDPTGIEDGYAYTNVVSSDDLSGSFTEDEDGVQGSGDSGEAFDESREVTSSSDMISIYICGAVVSPGVYELPRGSIVNDAVVVAGGFTDEAASDRLDLVFILNENRTLYIPTVGEVESGADYQILSFGDGVVGGTLGSSSDTAISETCAALVNINTASQAELEALPGVGPSTAQAIMAYREESNFTRIEDIMNVPGIGQGRFERIRDLICTG